MSTITVVEEAGDPATPSAGKVVLYSKTDSRVYIKDDAGNVVRIDGLTLGTEQTASGTAVDFTSIPSWVKKITIQFVGVSTNGTSIPLVQLGDSGGVETTGYLGGTALLTDAAAVQAANFTAGIGLSAAWGATSVIHGTVTLTLEDEVNFTWVAEIRLGFSNAAQSAMGGASKSLSAALDRVRITTVNGTDTFDAGSINILLE